MHEARTNQRTAGDETRFFQWLEKVAEVFPMVGKMGAGEKAENLSHWG